MKRRSFLQAIIGAAAAVTVPRVAAQVPKDGVAALADAIQERMAEAMLAQANRICSPPIFTRATVAWWVDNDGLLHMADINEPRKSQ